MIYLKNKTNERIRYVAFKLFLEKGYEATNIRDICCEVNIKASSLYFYYKSKKELFFSIYDEIWSENIRHLQYIRDLNNNNNTSRMILYNLYKMMMRYYTEDMIKQKFLLRFHLFPPEEISELIREKYKNWVKEDNEIYLDIINICLDRKVLNNDRNPFDYLQEYKRFINYQVTEIIISNIKISDADMDKQWFKFWNSMLGGI